MTSRELEQTVCYMLKLDRNWRSIAPVPIRNKPLRRFASDPEVTVDDIYLIPGGRWLLILTRESITLWDVDAELLTEPTATVAHFENSYEQSYMVVDSNDMPTSSNVLVVSIEE